MFENLKAMRAPIELQADYFDRHLELAERLDLPFVVHCREAESDIVDQLTRFANGRSLRGIMHSYAGDAQTCATCLALGMHISFAGMVTFKKNEDLRSVAKTVPLDRLLIETDSPYLAPVPNRGKRNEPSFVRHTAQCLADVHNISLETLLKQTTANARELFALPDSLFGQ